MIYLDNAATTRPKPPGVAEAVIAAMAEHGNSGRGAHEEALAASRSVYGVRRQIAELFRCPRPDHVAFTPNSTMALNIAVSGLLGPGGPCDLHGPGAQLRPAAPVPPAEQGGEVDFPPRRTAGGDRL